MMHITKHTFHFNIYIKTLPIIFQSILIYATSFHSEFTFKHLSTRVVNTRYGTVRGFISTLSNRQLQPVEVFLGVPYAGPPIGSLRFMPPVTSPYWSGIKITDKFGSVCPQKYPNISNETEALKRMPLGRYKYLQKLYPYFINQSEDCLYLNIYAPAIGECKRIFIQTFFNLFYFLCSIYATFELY